jgi:Lipocalin-like domain
VSLRDGLIGAWNLETFVARDVATDEERHPLGDAPRGLITYTGDGHMSAQLARADMSEYVAYGGRFVVDESASTVRHDVTMSTMPDLLSTPLVRHASLDGDRLVLSVTTTDEQGTATSSTLSWSRAE